MQKSGITTWNPGVAPSKKRSAAHARPSPQSRKMARARDRRHSTPAPQALPPPPADSRAVTSHLSALRAAAAWPAVPASVRTRQIPVHVGPSPKGPLPLCADNFQTPNMGSSQLPGRDAQPASGGVPIAGAKPQLGSRRPPGDPAGRAPLGRIARASRECSRPRYRLNARPVQRFRGVAGGPGALRTSRQNPRLRSPP